MAVAVAVAEATEETQVVEDTVNDTVFLPFDFIRYFLFCASFLVERKLLDIRPPLFCYISYAVYVLQKRNITWLAHSTTVNKFVFAMSNTVSRLGSKQSMYKI